MPWLSIIMFIISFLSAKSQGASTGKAAAIGAAAGLATYYLADPANPDNLLGFGGEEKATIGDVGVDNGGTIPTDGGGNASQIGGVIKTGLSEAGGVLKSWGPTGTLAVAAGTTALLSDDNKWILYAGAALVLLLLLK